LPIIEVRKLTFTYAGASRPSLVNVNMTVDPGEFIVLTGPSGCGKTTICRFLNGLIPNFYSGEMIGDVIVAGLNVRECSTSELAKYVGFVFQNPENQLFSLSIKRDVAFGPENLGLPKEEIIRNVEWALEVTGVSHISDRAPYELSGGQQQRAAIACVLAMKPNIMVLDEPTSYLDPKSAREILEVIAKLNNELGITIILVEHRLDLVSRYADRVIVMDKGKKVLDGKPSEVYGEEAYLIGVGLPRVTMLYHLLRKDNVKLRSTPITVEEASEELRRLLGFDSN
jgi:energy-coupling factor transporter ATP-binding protein EcfA2